MNITAHLKTLLTLAVLALLESLLNRFGSAHVSGAGRRG